MSECLHTRRNVYKQEVGREEGREEGREGGREDVPSKPPCNVSFPYAWQPAHTDGKLVGGNREDGERNTVLDGVTHSGRSTGGGLCREGGRGLSACRLT